MHNYMHIQRECLMLLLVIHIYIYIYVYIRYCWFWRCCYPYQYPEQQQSRRQYTYICICGSLLLLLPLLSPLPRPPLPLQQPPKKTSLTLNLLTSQILQKYPYFFVYLVRLRALESTYCGGLAEAVGRLLVVLHLRGRRP
jgi:hypothetical protein